MVGKPDGSSRDCRSLLVALLLIPACGGGAGDGDATADAAADAAADTGTDGLQDTPADTAMDTRSDEDAIDPAGEDEVGAEADAMESGDADADADAEDGDEPPARIWGVTIDDPWNLDPTVEALAALPRRPTARVVFDEGVPASEYLVMVPPIHAVADVMGEILDSEYVDTVSVPQYEARTTEYLDVLGPDVDFWEVGNEANGEWLGSTGDVVAKISGAYALVKARGARAALTLYYNDGCWSYPDHEMFEWAEANVPEDMKAGLDLVLVSYYEDDCENLQPDWPAVMARLAAMFPQSRIGIGECGTSFPDRKQEYLERYYGMEIAEPAWIGGHFWWWFSQDMVPSTLPLWGTLRDVMLASP